MTVEVMRELVDITVLADNTIVVLLSDELQDLKEKKRRKMLGALTVMARSQVGRDFVMVDRSEIVKISEQEVHRDVLLNVKILCNSSKNVNTLVYFGGQFKPDYKLKYALSFVLEVLSKVEEQQ